MKHMTRAVLVMAATLTAFTGVQAAGRGIDNPAHPLKGVSAGSAVSGFDGASYAGRPSDTHRVGSTRGEGEAEFAVMEVEGDATTGQRTSVYHGRPMDSYRTLVR
jgi:hypothetical protein